jgi:DNA-binding HxlR family transcriptional regulator
LNRRTYEQYCAVAKALDLVGERWTLLILRDLVHLGPRRYTDLLGALPGIGTNLLAARLRQLEDEGLVQKRRLSPPAGSVVYELTELGAGLEPTIIELGRWGGNFMAERRDCDVFFPSGHISAVRATFDPERAGDLALTAEFRVDGDVFFVAIDNGSVIARQGEAVDPDLVVETDVESSIDLMLRRLSPAAALSRKRVRLHGSKADFLRLIDVLAWVPGKAKA